MQINNRSKLEPIRSVFEKWVQRLRALYMPGKTVTVDQYNLEVYVGRNRNCSPEAKPGERVTLTLTKFFIKRNVTADNIFVSYSLNTQY